jgi:hypothetical protein
MQEAKIAAANKEYDNYAYINAIQTYEVAQKDTNQYPFSKLEMLITLMLN